MRTATIRVNRAFLRHKSSFPRRSGSKRVKPQEKHDTEGKNTPRPVTELLQALKSPIQKSKKAIFDLESVLEKHQYKRKADEEDFHSRLAEHDKYEPQLKWYHDQLGLEERKT